MNLATLTPQQLRAAADLKAQIERLEEQLNQLVGTETHGRTAAPVAAEAPARPTKGTKKRKLSAQGLANIRAGVAKRMAKKTGMKVEASPAKAKGKPAKQTRKTKKQVSEALLKALAKAREARWAKVRAETKAKA